MFTYRFKKYLVLVLSILFIGISNTLVSSQEQNIDTHRIDFYNLRNNNTRNIDSLKTAYMNAKKSEDEKKKSDSEFQKNKAILLNNISLYNLNNREILVSLEQAMLSLEISENFSFKYEKVVSLLIIIDSYKRNGYLTYAINYIKILLNFIKEEKDYKKIYVDKIIDNGKLFFQIDELDRAETFLLQGLIEARFNKFLNLEYSSLYYLGLLANKQGNYEISNEFYKQLLTAIGNDSVLFYKANSVNNIGDNYEKLRDYDKAEKFYELGLELNITEKNFSGIGTSYISLSDVSKLKGDFEKTIIYLKNSNKAFIQGDLLNNVAKNYKYLHTLYKENSDYKKALEYLEKSNSLMDSLFYSSREKSIKFIELEMEKKEKENKILSLQLESERTNLYIIIGFFIFLILFFFFVVKIKLRGNKINALELKEGKTKAELLSLQAKINPHFLFNSLNSISRLILKDSKAADKMIQNLSSLLRYTLQKAKLDKVTLSDEILVVTKYLEIEKIRFGNRLDYNISIDDTVKEFFIPPLIIQPLIENSIKHGISNLIEGGKIELKCYPSKSGKGLEILVTDNGQSSSSSFSSSSSSKKEIGFGLNYIKKTLAMIYKDKYSFTVDNKIDGYTVKIVIL